MRVPAHCDVAVIMPVNGISRSGDPVRRNYRTEHVVRDDESDGPRAGFPASVDLPDVGAVWVRL
jgi:hypothetical protein